MAKLLLLHLVLAQSVFLRRQPDCTFEDPSEPCDLQPRVPRLFFLMTANWFVEWEEIWVDFLSGGELGYTVQAFLHCEDHWQCVEHVKRRDILKLIPTVPSQYCANLVSPMLALLDAAVHSAHVSGPGHPDDAFIFVSSNSLPVKPFWAIKKMLIEDHPGMALFKPSQTTECGLFKASQWSVLRSRHAERMLESAADQKFDKQRRKRKLMHMPRGCSCCLDENWPIVSIFGVEALQRYPSEVPATLRLQQTTWVEWQGQHIDHLDFPEGEGTPGGGEEGESKLVANPDGPEELGPGEGEEGALKMLAGPYGPQTLPVVTEKLVTSLRLHPDILFIRKLGRETMFEGINGSGGILSDAW
eukprot:CAMPEP_0171183572 /NCGR_PEP_ID=MMETSP0790-20130122/15348_1 /TAXON_ID=2925 /ORGANISM="Alexandrium catenella, Strain OF101" /LENGTH=357 /DNA_ID=CAMNT_0011648553 /DNA_START=126 /DNA_END=1196 /DNA_ORIENTATION=+